MNAKLAIVIAASQIALHCLQVTASIFNRMFISCAKESTAADDGGGSGSSDQDFDINIAREVLRYKHHEHFTFPSYRDSIA